MDLSHNTRIICDHYTFWIYIVGTRGSQGQGVFWGKIWPKIANYCSFCRVTSTDKPKSILNTNKGLQSQDKEN